MKQISLYLSLMLLLLFSCKSHRDVSLRTIDNTRGESLVTTNDSLKTHLETSLKTEGDKQEDRVEYSKQTNFGDDNNVVSTTERIVIYASNFKFNRQLDQIKAADFKYSGSTQTSNTSDRQLNEDIKETSDSRLIQGWEWLYVIIGTSIVIAVILMYIKRRVRK